MTTNTFQQNHPIKPAYGSACFADIPQFVKYLLLNEGTPVLNLAEFAQLPQHYDQVILLFIDAFGWRFLQKYADDYPFLKRIAAEGVVAKLTSQFPSTTSAHVTTMHTNQPVGQHGVFEWYYYEPLLDAMISPLHFSFAGDKKPNTLQAANIEPSQLLPTQTFHQDLQQHGLRSFVSLPQAYAKSPYNSILNQGATSIAYHTFPEALVNMQQVLTKRTGEPTYFFLYVDTVDAISHRYGPESTQVEAEIDALLTLLERWFQREAQGQLKNTLLMITADHGQIAVDPDTTLYLNLLPQTAELQRLMKVNGKGELLVPGGSSRDMFLYIKDDLLAEAQDFVATLVKDKATVYQTTELINQGYFGPDPVSATFLGRVGNLLILPHKHETVWWYERGKFKNLFYGHHGGLSPEEAEIPLLLYPFQ